jgi:hypothetical protein
MVMNATAVTNRTIALAEKITARTRLLIECCGSGIIPVR